MEEQLKKLEIENKYLKVELEKTRLELEKTRLELEKDGKYWIWAFVPIISIIYAILNLYN